MRLKGYTLQGASRLQQGKRNHFLRTVIIIIIIIIIILSTDCSNARLWLHSLQVSDQVLYPFNGTRLYI